MGDFTARVGDPSGRSATRPVLSGEEIDAHARTYVEQAGKVLRTDERLELRHNSEWLDMGTEELFRLARVPTVAQLLERDDFARRFKAHGADLAARAAVPGAAGLRLGRGARRTSSSAGPTRPSTC